jgi:hypothetical protein
MSTSCNQGQFEREVEEHLIDGLEAGLSLVDACQYVHDKMYVKCRDWDDDVWYELCVPYIKERVDYYA